MATAPYDTMVVPTEPKKSSGCLKGCLIVFVILVVLAVIAGILFWINRHSIAAGVATMATDEMINESDFPPQEKDEMKAEVAKVADALRQNKLTGTSS